MNSVCRAIKTDLLLAFNNIADRIAYETKEELGSYYELWSQLVSTKLVQEGYRRRPARLAFTGEILSELPEYVIVKGSSLPAFNLTGGEGLTLNVDYFTNRWECFVHNLRTDLPFLNDQEFSIENAARIEEAHRKIAMESEMSRGIHSNNSEGSNTGPDSRLLPKFEAEFPLQKAKEASGNNESFVSQPLVMNYIGYCDSIYDSIYSNLLSDVKTRVRMNLKDVHAVQTSTNTGDTTIYASEDRESSISTGRMRSHSSSLHHNRRKKNRSVYHSSPTNRTHSTGSLGSGPGSPVASVGSGKFRKMLSNMKLNGAHRNEVNLVDNRENERVKQERDQKDRDTRESRSFYSNDDDEEDEDDEDEDADGSADERAGESMYYSNYDGNTEYSTDEDTNYNRNSEYGDYAGARGSVFELVQVHSRSSKGGGPGSVGSDGQFRVKNPLHLEGDVNPFKGLEDTIPRESMNGV